MVLLGVRHHGPGSARAVRRALAAAQPDIVLVEGPPEADRLVALAADPAMKPPVALLAYPVDDGPGRDAGIRAAFWPFGEFSPEWQAIRWALAASVPIRFCDLPISARFGATDADRDEAATREGLAQRRDPIGVLAEAAGYSDPERWWEDVVEHQRPAAAVADDDSHAFAPFEAIAAAMDVVRRVMPELPGQEQLEEDRREAHMRQVLRDVRKRYGRIAVVCGAWHVPALADPLPPAAADARILRGLPRTKVAMTWVPWTHGRLASWTGYGAGVTSPGWYHHLFTAADRVVERWLTSVGGVLREEGLPISSAHIIEAVRLANALAALRGRPVPGLDEVTEATRAVLCDGDDLRVELVNRRLVVGERLGAIPADTPGVPLARDLAATQRRLRFPASALAKDTDLDLRRQVDAERSRLLHRLRLLDVAWGKPVVNRRGEGTFWESWHVVWKPEYAVDVIAASGYGPTVPAAATARAIELAGAARTLGEVTGVVERCLLADLPRALDPVLSALDERMALDTDVAHLMDAMPALARTLRYGDVRGTDNASLRAVTTTMLIRIRIGLPAALTGLDDDAASAMRGRLDAVHGAIPLVGDGAAVEWLDALSKVVDRDDLPGLLGGRITRLLHDAGRLDRTEVERRLGLVLTIGVPPARGAAWIEGFLAGGGLVLVHDEPLLRLVDGWIAGIPSNTFDEVLPLLRRTFGAFAAPHRRAIGDRVRHLDVVHADRPDDRPDPRSGVVLPTLEALLGRPMSEVIA